MRRSDCQALMMDTSLILYSVISTEDSNSVVLLSDPWRCHTFSLWLCWSVSVLPSSHSSIIFTRDVMISGEYSLPSCIYMKHCNALFFTVISSLILWLFTPLDTWLLQQENYLVAHDIFKIQHHGRNTETSNKYLANDCVNSSLTLIHSLVPHTSLTTLYLIQNKGK